MTDCSALLSVNVIKNVTKSNLRKKNLFGLHLHAHNPSLRDITPGVQAGTEAETMVESYFLVCSQWSAQLVFFFLYTLGPPT